MRFPRRADTLDGLLSRQPWTGSGRRLKECGGRSAYKSPDHVVFERFREVDPWEGKGHLLAVETVR